VRAIARRGRAHREHKLRELVYRELRKRPQFGPNIKKLKGWQPETWRYRTGS
jgi:mRNA interferase RelE/StbE